MRKKEPCRRRRGWIPTAALLAVMAAAVLLTSYIQSYYHAWELEPGMLSGARRAADEGGWIAYGEPDAQRGFVFYPGAKVEETAYAPLMERIANEGFFCVLVRMPVRLAILDNGAAERVMDAYPEISSWYLGGHSLGGAMAASYSAKNADRLEGLVLLAAYSTVPIPEGLAVLSLYGSEDGVLNREKYREYLKNLPADYAERVIEGGNHAGFGWYGPQKGDGEAALPPWEQWEASAWEISRWAGMD